MTDDNQTTPTLSTHTSETDETSKTPNTAATPRVGVAKPNGALSVKSGLRAGYAPDWAGK